MWVFLWVLDFFLPVKVLPDPKPISPMDEKKGEERENRIEQKVADIDEQKVSDVKDCNRRDRCKQEL